MNKTKQMKNLKNGCGFQYLIDEGYKILGNPIVTFDTNYDLIAHADVSCDDRFWNELMSNRTFGIEAQIFFMNECFTDIVANAKKLAIMKSAMLKYDRILGHIYNGDGVKVANVLMIEYKEAFEPDVITAFEILSDLLTKEIRDDDYYITYGEAYHNTWINKLIDYDIEAKRLYSSHVQILYNDFKTNLYAAVVDISRNEERYRGQKHFVDLLRQKRRDFKYAVYNDYIVMIMSTSYKTFSVKRDLNVLADYFKLENMLVGISRCFDNLFELRKYYAEAVGALDGVTPDDSRHIIMSRD